jgi:molecular chaperone GrpE
MDNKDNIDEEQIDIESSVQDAGSGIDDTAKSIDTDTDNLDEEPDYKNQYLRALADYQNLAKNSAADKQEFARYALSSFLEELLPIYDHLKISISGLSEAESQSPWVVGVQYVLKQFKDLLASRGVEEIVTIGQKFDHQTMEAMAGQGEIVSKELRPGYKLNGRVIIAAKVEVGD